MLALPVFVVEVAALLVFLQSRRHSRLPRRLRPLAKGFEEYSSSSAEGVTYFAAKVRRS